MRNLIKLIRQCGGLLLMLAAGSALAATGNKPNILVVWGDDIVSPISRPIPMA